MLNYNEEWLKNICKKVIIKDREFNYYDETKVGFLEMMSNELSIELKKLMLEKNFKMFNFICEPNTNLQIFINKFNFIDTEKTDLKTLNKIKFFQKNDFMYLYLNNIFKVFFAFPFVNDNNIYSYNFVILADDTFDINKVYNHNFNLVKIKSVVEVYAHEVNFWLLNKWINGCTFIKNTSFGDKKSDKWMYYYINMKDFKNELSKKPGYIDNYLIEHEIYLNAESKISFPMFEQNYYASCCFEAICIHFYSVDRTYCKIINKSGWMYGYRDIFGLNKQFITNYDELMGSVLYNSKTGEITNSGYTFCCLSESFHLNGVKYSCFSEEYILNNIINFENLEEISEEKFRNYLD